MFVYLHIVSIPWMTFTTAHIYDKFKFYAMKTGYLRPLKVWCLPTKIQNITGWLMAQNWFWYIVDCQKSLSSVLLYNTVSEIIKTCLCWMVEIVQVLFDSVSFKSFGSYLLLCSHVTRCDLCTVLYTWWPILLMSGNLTSSTSFNNLETVDDVSDEYITWK